MCGQEPPCAAGIRCIAGQGAGELDFLHARPEKLDSRKQDKYGDTGKCEAQEHD